MVLIRHSQSIHEGEFIAQFPLIPGHEAVGVVAAMGPKVTGFEIGDRIAADCTETCGHCFYCRRGEVLLCEHVRVNHTISHQPDLPPDPDT